MFILPHITHSQAQLLIHQSHKHTYAQTLTFKYTVRLSKAANAALKSAYVLIHKGIRLAVLQHLAYHTHTNMLLQHLQIKHIQVTTCYYFTVVPSSTLQYSSRILYISVISGSVILTVLFIIFAILVIY